ncbi:FAD-binding oxidoreductase [Xanthobacter sp. DSM 24535]|uniref:FAD-binding oxidoreductase n=1 Tax=Roseixanthobacter psychrophilus TaxID=3119917 RepID=UPI0037274693
MQSVRRAYRSWGGVLRAESDVVRPLDPARAARLVQDPHPQSLIAYGCGRSYGDVALNPGGMLVDTRHLDCFMAFDPESGLLTCEAGVRLADIFAVISHPEADGSGWMLPVVPGTRFVSVGGAIANDVHGKNDHACGSFGNHVVSLELARSDGNRFICSRKENPGLFSASIGGMGLTGLILSATLRLRKVSGLALESEEIRFGHLDDFFALDAESAEDWEYTAAWVDCLAKGAQLGRGIYLRARHAPGVGAPPPSRATKIVVPFAPPISAVNALSLRAFNAAYWRKLGKSGRKAQVASYEKTFFPLDAIGQWNHLYGPRGFYQFQAVIPTDAARDGTADLLRAIVAAGQGSMLVVLKRFGTVGSPGLMSFPMPGVTLALDFPNLGEGTLRLLRRLEEIVVAAHGRIYPAKDFSMSAETYAKGYPALSAFRHFLDPAMSSAFSRRVGIHPAEPQP